MLHYMTTYMRYEPGWWEDYREANRRFADRVLSTAADGDMVWVHDYQLMLVPAMLKQANPRLRVGFFLHTPFPSYEVFRCHPKRRALLEGMLGADLVGFHTFGYLRHFRSAAVRLLGMESDVMRIRQGAHTTRMGVYPIGINAAKFEAELDSPGHAALKRRLRESNPERKIVLSVERLDYTKGIPRRLAAVRLFLEGCKDPDGIKFIFVSVPSREGVEQYRELRALVEARVGRLNGRFATLHNNPVHFLHRPVPFDELCALYAAADVALVTPLIDGMNLVAKEYVAAKRDEAGVLVLSEFAGAAQELFNAVQVNPYDPPAMAEAIREALSMPEQARRERMRPMRERVMELDAAAWARSFVDDLARTEPAPAQRDPGAEERIRTAVAAGQRVALFLDYDGTLREIESEPHLASPNEAVRSLLGDLRDAGLAGVTVVSGRTAADLEAWLGDYGFGLVAEHGAAVRRPGTTEWERFDHGIGYTWKDELMRILKLYERSTPGSFVEQKRTSLVWHYRKADPEFGEWKAKQLVEELGATIANEPLEVRHGKKIVEVTATHVNKGAAVLRLLAGEHYDLVVVAGDDTTDESMFRMHAPNLVTIKIGDGHTQAQYRVATPAAFRAMLADALAGRRRPQADAKSA
jgi:trehalose 6-phosphate synthase/phosphatase